MAPELLDSYVMLIPKVQSLTLTDTVAARIALSIVLRLGEQKSLVLKR